ncbi:SulP family inorganic anion transporter [Magnetovibrio blakemorei]|uniref:Sodium-independent anion transporter n=1 Tax=Magnetovibrio blakemorei TaxID=28181 RepID=A0A1E5Q644_9PROT|nr:SulP family inorganic anion transporter [Magnetovibrio blakemorei]OEJ65985.1 sodium-independent anion transporter [Magnetovibrio blakemorei]
MPTWHLFIPKLFTVLREGYGASDLKSDAISGLTVAIVALPLAMALAIASGVPPERGLYTAIIGGFIISFFGGSRFQIGGPTGAFVVVVFNVVHEFGYEGLVIASLMAGVFLLIAGFAQLGTYIKYIPYPVVTGFTAGIAVIIFSSQVKDLLGLQIASPPPDFVDKWVGYGEHLSSFSAVTVLISAAALATIVILRKTAPQAPGFLIAIVGASIAVWGFGLDSDTIGQRFGEIPHMLPAPQLPDFSAFTFDRLVMLLPSAFTIAFLAGVESLLSAVVADGMTGRRHRSNCELVAQGLANIGSVILGGIPATGAIARTATNIRAGARSPLSGIFHAAFLLLFMMILAPLMPFVPLAALAAVLTIVAWNMSEFQHFRHLMRAPAGDRLVLLTTFLLTVLVDLTAAIEAGVVLAAILFMHRMAQAVEIETHHKLIDEDVDDLTDPISAPYSVDAALPEDVTVFTINGPFFFGAAARLSEVLEHIGQAPKVFILRMRYVPFMDATGVTALLKVFEQSHSQGTQIILCRVQPQPRKILNDMCAQKSCPPIEFAVNFEDAQQRAITLMAE